MKHLENFILFNHDVKAQLKRFIYDRSDDLFAAGDQARDAVRSTSELETRNSFLREKLIRAAELEKSRVGVRLDVALE